MYPGYEYFKRWLLGLAGSAMGGQEAAAVPEAMRVPLVLLAGAMATVVACLGVCPAETVRIRSVSARQPPRGGKSPVCTSLEQSAAAVSQ